MDAKDISAMREQMEEVPHVKSVIWYDSLADISIPMEMLPAEIYDFFNNDEKDSTLLAVLYDTSMSADETMDAIEELRGVVKDQCYISGMSAVVTDIKNLSNKETPVYVLIAVVLAVIVLSLTMDSALAPIFFLLSIGMAIVYNLGTNVFKGEISYVTQALAAVLQLGVTMDYSIFLWHSYGLGIHAIWNFAHVDLELINKDVVVREIKNVRWRMRFLIRSHRWSEAPSRRWLVSWHCVS